MSELCRRVARLAQEDPEIRPFLVPLLKTAAFDFPGIVVKAISDADERRRKTLSVVFAQLIDKLDKALLKHEFVVDRRKTYVEDYEHHEGTRFEGMIVFVDKRDHNPRSRDEVENILQKVAEIWGFARMVEPGVWKVSIGE